MAKKLPIIYWFEDESSELDRLEKIVLENLNGRAELKRFVLSEEDNAKAKTRRDGSYRHRIFETIRPDLSDIRLIICDEDLSRSTVMPGLSADPIETLAQSEGIPLVVYSKGAKDEIMKRILKNRSFAERRFLVDLSDRNDEDKFGDEILNIFNGCQQVFEFISKETKSKTKGSKKGGATPSALMSKLLGDESMEPRLRLYASGDQQYLESLLTTSPEDEARYIRILSTELSYWLWESVLRFPGIFVNEVAAASLLLIDSSEFSKQEYQKYFKTALYVGPFSEKGCFWWRDKLHGILMEEGCDDGFAYLKCKGKRPKSRCACSVDPNLNAGYYCMITKKPVSYEKSKGNISYFPKGADLARVSERALRREMPWAGFSS